MRIMPARCSIVWHFRTDETRGFQRYAPHLPSAEEMVLFNRSWYNRAGVERVMGFCTKAELAEFFEAVVPSSACLSTRASRSSSNYLDISKDEQGRRLEERRADPLKQWKVSPIDQVAVKRWKAYSRARNEMLARTHNDVTPWFVVRADDKRETRLNVIRHILARIDCPAKDEHAASPDERIVFPYDDSCVAEGHLAA